MAEKTKSKTWNWILLVLVVPAIVLLRHRKYEWLHDKFLSPEFDQALHRYTGPVAVVLLVVLVPYLIWDATIRKHK